MLNTLKFLFTVAKHRRQLKPVVANHLHFSNQQDYSLWGSIGEQDSAGIEEAVAEASKFEGPIVEIGVLFGLTTQLIATLKPENKSLIGVDNYAWNPFYLPPEHHKVITQRSLRYIMDHCQTSLFEGSSADFYKSYKGPTPAMVFIDGDHRYEGVVEDIAGAKRLKIPVICGHDYSPQFPGVIQAVDEAFGKSVRVVGSVWIAGGAN